MINGHSSEDRYFSFQIDQDDQSTVNSKPLQFPPNNNRNESLKWYRWKCQVGRRFLLQFWVWLGELTCPAPPLRSSSLSTWAWLSLVLALLSKFGTLAAWFRSMVNVPSAACPNTRCTVCLFMRWFLQRQLAHCSLLSCLKNSKAKSITSSCPRFIRFKANVWWKSRERLLEHFRASIHIVENPSRNVITLKWNSSQVGLILNQLSVLQMPRFINNR